MQLQTATIYQGVPGIAPRNPAGEEDQILEPMSSPLAIFLQDTLRNVTEHITLPGLDDYVSLPKRTQIVSDNPRIHGDPFRDEKPITLPDLDDYVVLEGFMTNLLQERQIAPSNVSILNDNDSRSIRQDETPVHFNESFSADDVLFDIETEDGELIRHLSIFGHTSSSSRTSESFSAWDLEDDTERHIFENVTAILRQDPRSSDLIESTSHHQDIEEGEDQEFPLEDLAIIGESSTSSASIFQQSFHTIQGSAEEMDPAKEISPTGVVDHSLLHPQSPNLQKIKDEGFELEVSERETEDDCFFTCI
jgi:hypothetical protein